MAVSQKKRLARTALAVAVTWAVSVTALAGTVVVKPGAQNTFAPEFGSTIARSSSYTLVGAQQETVVIPGEPIFTGGNVAAQGAVYLFNGTSTSAERVYQFPGNNHFYKKAGAKVAISDKWLAFAAVEDFANSGNPSSVYIVGKTNNQWTQCPTVNAVVDCTSLVKNNGTAGSQPILRIPFSSHVDAPQMSLAISDNYLVIGNRQTSEVFIYRHDAVQNQWVLELSVDDLDERHLGTAVAIDGDKIAVSAPFFNELSDTEPGLEKGTVRIYKRSSSGTWNVATGIYGHFTAGNFGRALDMHNGNLSVSSGMNGSDQHLTFLRVDANGSVGTPDVHLTATPTDFVAVHGDTAVVTTDDLEAIARIYKRNTSNNTWSQTGALNGYLYMNPSNNYPYAGADQIDLVGDDVVFGWRAYQNLVGGFIREKVSQIDLCKSTLNLVVNCSFDNNSGNGWQFLTHQGASASVNYNGGQLNATIYNPGSVHWNIQARTAVNLSAGGTYQLQFRAKAPSFRDITVNIGHNGNQDNNWQSYGQTTFRPGPEWTHYVYEFYGVPADANAFLDFNLGNAGTTGISLDGISLTPLDM